jgi:hypothetical protein
MRRAAIIRINPGFDKAAFGRAKGQGLFQTSFEDMVMSLDGKKAFLSWPTIRPADVPAGLVLFEGTEVEVRTEMLKNPAEWRPTHGPGIGPAPIQPVAFREMDSETRPAVEATPTAKMATWKKVAAGAAAVAAAGSGLYYLLG